MPVYNHHICFVSHQNVAELLGALAPQCSCSHVHALVSPEMTEKARNLQESCLRKKLKFTAYKTPDMEQETISGYLNKIRSKHPGESFAVNISGGKKLTSISAF